MNRLMPQVWLVMALLFSPLAYRPAIAAGPVSSAVPALAVGVHGGPADPGELEAFIRL